MASSQAGEEPTTDDELVSEVILSPLFSKKSIEFALESAHLDFDDIFPSLLLDICLFNFLDGLIMILFICIIPHLGCGISNIMQSICRDWDSLVSFHLTLQNLY